MVRVTIKPTSVIRGLLQCPDHPEHQAERSYTVKNFGTGYPAPRCNYCGVEMVLVELEVTES